MEAIVLALGASLRGARRLSSAHCRDALLGALRTLVYVQLGGLAAIALIVAVRWSGPEGQHRPCSRIPRRSPARSDCSRTNRGIAVGAISIVAPIAGISAIVP
jgi:hypothetical protein